MILLRRLCLALTGFVMAAAGPSGSDSDAASYRLRLPVTRTGDAAVQRIEVPLQALIALQTTDMADMRVFDATGRMVPMARMPVLRAANRETVLPALPILGSSAALDVTGVSLKMDDQGRARIVSVDGKIATNDSAAIVIGALFDTRRLSGDVEQLALDATVPAGQPVTFTIEASEDLKSWRQIGDRVVYRAPDRGNQGGSETIALRGTLRRDTQLRLTWRAESRVLAPIAVRQAVLTTRRDTTAMITTVAVTAPPLIDSHTLDFVVPFATPIATLAVDTLGNEGLVPVRILGRNTSEAPWVLLGQGSAVSAAVAIVLRGQPVRIMRIEADRRTGGFRSKPAIRIGLSPHEIAFVASGQPPFTLAVGRAGASDVFLTLASLTGKAPATLPKAVVRSAPIVRMALLPIADPEADRRRLALWAILLAVTAVLGGIAWHLWSRRHAAPELS